MQGVLAAVLDWFQDVWERMPGGRVFQGIVGLVLLFLLVSIPLGGYWSIAPDRFDPVQEAKLEAELRGETVATGYTTVYALDRVVSTLLDKPGGYIRNDKGVPGIWLDNISNWEFGALVQSRDLSQALRKDFSRSQSQSVEVPALAEAEPKFSFDASSWILPSSESQYKTGLKELGKYRAALGDPSARNSQFFTRADNLNNWLGNVQTRLGSFSQRLSASVGQRRINTDLAGEPDASQSTVTGDETEVQTAWLEIDDVFYEARGAAWAILHFLKAVEQDFGPVLDKKNARVSLKQIIRELESTQDTVWSPAIMNGGGFGLFANHSLVMANYISRANAAIIDLRELLDKG